MKKVFIALAALAISASSMAQDRFALGIKTGFNSTNIQLSDASEELQNIDFKTEAKNGFLFGAYARLKLVGNLSFQPEIYYAKKSANYKYLGGNDGIDIHSWDIPLLAHLTVLDLEVLKVYGIAGPVASYNAKTVTDLPDPDDLKAEAEVKKANWTFNAGVGLDVWKLSADVRYEWGIVDISTINIGQRTNVLTFSLAYRLFGI